MSAPTAPKLTYAKIGNKSKNKIQPASTELLRGQEAASQDLFSHMNQDNLNYIKKELKLKKNRSEHDKPKSNNNDTDTLQEQVTQRDRIYHKYNKGEEELSERQPYLQETERRSSEERLDNIQLAEQVEEDFTQLMKQEHLKVTHDERRGLSTSHNGENAHALTRIPQEKMYQSLPYEQPKKRMVSIEGYVRQSISTNLQKHREQGHQFIQFLSDYISDLNQSKHLKSRPQEEDISIDKKSRTKKQSQQSQKRIREDFKKMERLKRNSDTFGEPNSKYSVNSMPYQSQSDLQLQLKRQRFNCIVLAKDVQTLREQLLQKDTIIKNLRVQNELLQEEITHLRTKQQIMMKNKVNQGFEGRVRSKQKKQVNDENLAQGYHNHFVLSHQRHGSVNPSAHRQGYSSRDFPPQNTQNQFKQTLFKQFDSSYKPAQTARKQESHSIQKLQNEYDNFLKNRMKVRRPYK